MLLRSFSESTPFIWLLNPLYFTIYLKRRVLGGTPEDGVQNPLYLAAQHYRQSSATVRYPFGYNAQLKIVYFSNGR